MKDRSAEVPARIQSAISAHLTAIAGLWDSPRVTLLLRFPAKEALGLDADFIMTNDSLAHVAAMVERRRNAT